MTGISATSPLIEYLHIRTRCFSPVAILCGPERSIQGSGNALNNAEFKLYFYANPDMLKAFASTRTGMPSGAGPGRVG
jgi:hypothetical protein